MSQPHVPAKPGWLRRLALPLACLPIAVVLFAQPFSGFARPVSEIDFGVGGNDQQDEVWRVLYVGNEPRVERISELTAVRQIVGDYVLLNDGTLRHFDEYQQLVEDADLIGMRELSGGRFSAGGLSEDGSVWILNDAALTPQGFSGLTIIEGLPEMESLTVSNHTAFAVTAEGEVWSWGNAFARTSGCHLTPARVPELDGTVDLAASDERIYALYTDGTVRTWTGLGRAEECPGVMEPDPKWNILVLPGVISLATGSSHILAIDWESRLWNLSGAAPESLDAVSPVVQVAENAYGVVVLTASGDVWHLPAYDWNSPQRLEVPSIASLDIAGRYLIAGTPQRVSESDGVFPVDNNPPDPALEDPGYYPVEIDLNPGIAEDEEP
jgi:hypothetical protein